MPQHPHILVTYATRMESTSDVAEAIGMSLREQGYSADVMPVDEVDSLADYTAVILGSAIRVGAWLPEAIRFLETFREALSTVPVAYFTVCMTMREDTPQNRATVLNYMKPVLDDFPKVDPFEIGLFGGMFNTQEFPRAVRWILSKLNFPSGDFRNWESIQHWVHSLMPHLSEESTLNNVD